MEGKSPNEIAKTSERICDSRREDLFTHHQHRAGADAENNLVERHRNVRTEGRWHAGRHYMGIFLGEQRAKAHAGGNFNPYSIVKLTDKLVKAVKAGDTSRCASLIGAEFQRVVANLVIVPN